MKNIAIFLLLTLTLNAFAESKLCNITTDTDNRLTELLIETNSDGSLDSIRIYVKLGNKVTEDFTTPIERAIAEGIVASELDGRKIVILRAKAFDPQVGGPIILDHLYNGIKGTRSQYGMNLIKKNGVFTLTTTKGEVVNTLRVIGNRLPILGLVGVKEIRPSFDPAFK